ncbi:hypothetical protein ACFY1U_34585 [Streptomyces sp. NPDC001351]|uniref:hypothetical protein n=1 Tax=unclassified Streptomyces TaxID=2593676 RepID=UPI0036C5D4B8
MLAEIDEAGDERGTFGQTVFHVLTLDQDLEPKLVRVALDRALSDGVRFWAAAILLYLAGNDAAAVLAKVLGADETIDGGEGSFTLSRRLQDVDHIDHLVESVEVWGHVSLF